MTVDREEIKRKAARAIDNASDRELERVSNDKSYAHDWLQKTIGWIADLMNILTGAFSGCYISTALVEHLGLSDDCEQLKVLRQFRDNYIIQSGVKQRLEELDQYYFFASLLVDWIEQRSDSDRIWAKVEKSVNLSLKAISEERYDDAYRIYRESVLNLKTISILES